ncbi:TorF family putative porin [Povalibacter sp.]|uniref:TorF family putative porin n=1 Tax=Povalibacter sp. TaxID=1962978 RepID=UPI002F3E36FB
MRPSSATSVRTALAALCVCTCFWSSAGQAQASDRVGGSLAFSSDYVFRGLSHSEGRPALQADLHYEFAPGWVAGAWGSRADVDPDESPAAEIDVYLSRHWMIDDQWALRTTLTHYTYPDDPRAYSYSHDEVLVALGYQSRFFASASWSPNLTMYANEALAIEQSALAYEVVAVQPVVGSLAASAGVGYYDLPSALNADYWYWNVVLACSLGRTQIAVAYIAADRDAQRTFGYDRAAYQWTGSLAWRF